MISLENISITTGAFSLCNLSLRVATNEWAMLMGRTGSGKTTLLEIICGLRAPQSGRVILNGVDVTALPAGARGIGYVPQDRALFHTMTVRQNLAFALTIRRWASDAIDARVTELASLLSLGHLLDRFPRHLSGGESQRVALGRALATRPALLCLDEPLSALDDLTRQEIRDVLKSLRQTHPVTTLHVTHHLEDGQDLADRIVTLADGRIVEKK